MGELLAHGEVRPSRPRKKRRRGHLRHRLKLRCIAAAKIAGATSDRTADESQRYEGIQRSHRLPASENTAKFRRGSINVSTLRFVQSTTQSSRYGPNQERKRRRNRRRISVTGKEETGPCVEQRRECWPHPNCMH